ncbi:MAG: AzlD domain-containing protein [Treponema sp.]|nr:AzlD domain-containing protein [Treponema sp.]
MKTGISEALILSIGMAAAIYFCRLFPFLFFRGKNNENFVFLSFVEKTVPPVAMTVLAFNALAGSVQTEPRALIPALIAAVCTALVHLWRRNPLISIFGGTVLYMVLSRVF